MKIEQGQVVIHNKQNKVVMLTWGNQAMLAPVVGDDREIVDVRDITGISRVSPRQAAEEEAKH
jgi:hypothetical protein